MRKGRSRLTATAVSCLDDTSARLRHDSVRNVRAEYRRIRPKDDGEIERLEDEIRTKRGVSEVDKKTVIARFRNKRFGVYRRGLMPAS